MMEVVYTQFYNENEHRAYPFEDNMSLASNGDRTLPSSVIVDAILYPLELIGVPYLKKLDIFGDGVEIADSANNTVLMSGQVAEDDIIYLYDSYNRQLGTLVLGSGRDILADGFVYEFEKDNTRFAATCWTQLPNEGVQGFLLEDGTIVTGDIQFIGQNGVNVTSSIVSEAGKTDRYILEISVVGAIPQIDPVTRDDCISEGVPIRTINVITTRGSRLLGSNYDAGNTTLAITPRLIDLDTLCAAKRISPLPNPDDPADICDPPAPPTPDPETPSSEVVHSTTLTTSGATTFSTLNIVTPSPALVKNIIKVQPVTGITRAIPRTNVGVKGSYAHLMDLQSRLKYSQAGNSSIGFSIKGF